MSEIRDLVESYYNDVYIEEEQLDEMGTAGGNVPGGNRRITNAPYQSRFARPRNANTTVRNSATGEVLQKPKISSLPTDLKRTELSATAAGQRAAGKVGGGNAGASTSSSRPAADRPLPAGNPNLRLNVTPAAKVAPTAASKPTTPAPGTKAAGPESIKPKTPNPLLDGGELRRMQQASQMRQKGINVTSDQIAAAERTKPTTPKPTEPKKRDEPLF